MTENTPSKPPAQNERGNASQLVFWLLATITTVSLSATGVVIGRMQTEIDRLNPLVEKTATLQEQARVTDKQLDRIEKKLDVLLTQLTERRNPAERSQ